ncbi:MAG: galactose-1-phosphate uridylyltransferase [Methermicoccaceae archaeon]
MSEIRRHYFLDEYCIVAPERQKRPSDLKKSTVPTSAEGCPFCAGNEHMTPPAGAVYMPDGSVLSDLDDGRVRGWSVRCFPNMFPALSPDAPSPPEDSHSHVMGGYGFHEVIVESPEHGTSTAMFDDERMELLMRVYVERCAHYLSFEHVEYVSLFKNAGRDAGASLSHAHTQLIAMPMLAPRVAHEMAAFEGACPMCEVVRKEVGERLVCENEHFSAISPFCAKMPFEMWIVPKRHVSTLLLLNAEELFSLGKILRDVLFRLHAIVGDVSYNYMFFQHPSDERYHMYLKVLPKLSIIAGFELSTDVYINVVSPEDAAAYMSGSL